MSRPIGFTLIELLIAISISMLLAVIGVPSFNAYLRKQTLIQAAEDFRSDLRRMQTMSAKGSKINTSDSSSACWGVRVGSSCSGDYCLASYGTTCLASAYSLNKVQEFKDSRLTITSSHVNTIFRRLTGSITAARTFTISLTGSSCNIVISVNTAGSITRIDNIGASC